MAGSTAIRPPWLPGRGALVEPLPPLDRVASLLQRHHEDSGPWRSGSSDEVSELATASSAPPLFNRPLVLVVDDEASYRDALCSGLSQEGFDVSVAADGAHALSEFARRTPDVVLLDVMLPDRSGVEICRELQASSSVPIIMVTARSGEIDVVLGLEIGAADYVAKPYRLRELVARIRAVLRREAVELEDVDVLHVGPVLLDAARREAFVRASAVELSRKEFELLWLLLSRPGSVVSRESCIDAIWWGQDLLDSRTLDTHIKRLRRKIERDPSAPRHLITVRGIGFRFDS